MTVEEVESWTQTEEGKNWLESKKESVVKKNNQLLSEVADLKKRLTDATEQGNALSGKISGYLEKLKKEACFSCFDDASAFNNKVLIDDSELREFVLSKIERAAEADGGLKADIDDSGNFTYQTEAGKSFKDYYSEWLETDSAKSYIRNSSTGGGARGSGEKNGGTFTAEAIKKMTPQEVAKNLDNPAFRNSLNSQNLTE